MYDYGARYYDAAVGRWWAVDPLDNMFNYISSYSYAHNKPSVYVDKNGLFPFDPSFDRYPIIKKYIETQLKDFLLRPKVHNILQKYTLTKEQIEKDFAETKHKRNNTPILRVGNITYLGHGNGQCDCNTPIDGFSKIIFTPGYMEKIESILMNGSEYSKNTLLDFTSLFIHEYVHYGDYLDFFRNNYTGGDDGFGDIKVFNDENPNPKIRVRDVGGAAQREFNAMRKELISEWGIDISKFPKSKEKVPDKPNKTINPRIGH
jgi:hypothetical protein